jgi:hypothetical protein
LAEATQLRDTGRALFQKDSQQATRHRQTDAFGLSTARVVSLLVGIHENRLG